MASSNGSASEIRNDAQRPVGSDASLGEGADN